MLHELSELGSKVACVTSELVPGVACVMSELVIRVACVMLPLYWFLGRYVTHLNLSLE